MFIHIYICVYTRACQKLLLDHVVYQARADLLEVTMEQLGKEINEADKLREKELQASVS